MLVLDKDTNSDYLASYIEKARQLENQLQQINTPIQLNELAQEVATYHRILSSYSMAKEPVDQNKLAELLQKFSQLETEVLMKFYRNYKNIRRNSIL
jgi:transcriptional regulator of aromatic amino acid metabolism